MLPPKLASTRPLAALASFIYHPSAMSPNENWQRCQNTGELSCRSFRQLEAEIDDDRRSGRTDQPRAGLADRDPGRQHGRQGLRRAPPDFQPVIAEQCELARNGDRAREAQEVAADRHV